MAQIVFKNIGGPTRETEIWTMQCAPFINNLNKLIINNKLTLLTENNTLSFLAFTEALQRDEPNIDAYIRQKRLELRNVLPHELVENIDIRAFSADVDRFLSWLPFNLALGPSSTLRTDDPKEPANQQGRGGFEVNARCLFDCDPRLGGNKNMWTFLDRLDRFLSGRQPVDQEVVHDLCNKLTLLTQMGSVNIDKVNTPLAYNEKMWDKDRQKSTPGKLMMKLKTCPAPA
ncbi:hypothetical protein HK102_006551 [Quaeritorhiza haematococci]|nr:hypothetical protein HK102_006551 [Quaeritorhiza haematococci]